MQDGTNKLPKGTVLHESIKEWRRWRQDAPRRYTHIGDMPMLVSVGFEYLVNKYGKNDMTYHQEGHEELVARKKLEIDARNAVYASNI